MPVDLLGDVAPFLQDNMTIESIWWRASRSASHLPATVVLEVVEADPVVKGQTAASTTSRPSCPTASRPVPPFIETGEKIVVRTEDGSYVERVEGLRPDGARHRRGSRPLSRT